MTTGNDQAENKVVDLMAALEQSVKDARASARVARQQRCPDPASWLYGGPNCGHCGCEVIWNEEQEDWVHDR